MNLNCKIKLSEHTILREVMGKVYMNEVRKHTLLIMTQEAIPILNYLWDLRSYEEFKEFVQKNYEIDEEIDEYCVEFIESLEQLGFLKVWSGQNDNNKDSYTIESLPNYDNKVILEEEAIKRQQLLSVTIELTYLCNLKCKHCFVGDIRSKQLDKNFYFQLIDDLYEMGTLNIVFTGGEVFARLDAFDIIKYAVERNFIVDIFTNGTLIDNELFEKLCDINIHSIQSSIYSVDEKIHDEFVGQKGAFRKTINNLKKFSEKGILTAIKTCIFDFNCMEFDEIKKYAKSINATFQYTMTLLPRKDGMTVPMNYGISIEKLPNFIKRIDDTYYYEKEDNQVICSAGQTSLSINPEGKVFMCNAFDLEVGDLQKEKISYIWNSSETLNEWREATMVKRVQCQGCEYVNYCDFCPGSAYKLSGNPFLKYEVACNQAKNMYEVLGNL